MTIDTPRFLRATCSLAAVVALGTLAACAGPATPEPLYDYGQGLPMAAAPLHAQAVPTVEPLMDYGTGLVDLPATAVAKAGSPAVSASPLAALSR